MAVEQPHKRSQALYRLSCVVYGAGVGSGLAVAKPDQGVVDLRERHALQRRSQLLTLRRAFGRRRGRRSRNRGNGHVAAAPVALLLGSRDGDTEADRDTGGDGRHKRRKNLPMGTLPQARWWSIRRAANRKPATYRCPFCGNHLPSLSEHMLIMPEGDSSRRRHAHTACVAAARARGELPLRDDYLRGQPARPSLWRRLFSR